MHNPVVDIIVPCHGKAGITTQCLGHLVKTTDNMPYRVTVVDDCSPDNTPRMLRWWWINTRPWVPWAKYKGVPFRVIRTRNQSGFAKVNNLAAKKATAPWLLFMNNDAFPQQPDWLMQLVNTATLNGYDAIGPKGDNVLGLQCKYWDCRNWPPVHLAKFLSGYCLLIRREAFESVGGWDERFFMGDEDTALSVTLRRAGYVLGIDRGVMVRHCNQVTMKDFTAERGTNPSEWYARTRQQFLDTFGVQAQTDLFMWEELKRPRTEWAKLGVLDNGEYWNTPGSPLDTCAAVDRFRFRFRTASADALGQLCGQQPGNGEGARPTLGELCARYRWKCGADTFGFECA